MSDTTRLKLPRIDAAQSQKHVTHNEALESLDALVHLSVTARNVLSPPATPVEGMAVIVGPSALGAFAGQSFNVAAFGDNAWRFYAPRLGWRAYVESESLFYVFDGGDWVKQRVDLQDVQNLRYAGFGTSADAQNPISAKLNAALFAARSVGEGGTGDLRFTLNRSQGTNVVSQLYQSNWSGRAETGLMGDDKYRIKVSADGSTWKDALYADPMTGRVFFPNGASDLVASVSVTSGTPAAYVLSAPMRGALPEGAMFWMVPHVPNATALNVDPTLQIDQIDATPLPLKAFDGSTLPQGCLEAGKAIAVRKSGAVYVAHIQRSVPSLVNLVEDGGRFAGNPDPVSWAVATYVDVTWISNLNGAIRSNYGVARPGLTLNTNIADLLNKIRPAAAQASGSEFFVQQVTVGTGVTSPVTVQSTLHYPVLSSVRHIGRGITASAYFRVLSGSVVMASSETIARLLIDGVAHNIIADTPARLFNAASGWKHLQFWLTAPNGSTTSLWPIRATPGTTLLFALPSIVQGLETIPWDIGPIPSYRMWR
jgi:hypothetical protein